MNVRQGFGAIRSQIFDPAIIATIALRGWSVFAGVGTLVLVSTSLTKVQQGYYYTFASLLALQIFFELGLNFVLTQFVSHASVGLIPQSESRIQPDASAALIAGTILFVRRWFKWIAIAFMFAVGLGGLLFLSNHIETAPTYWQTTWLIMCLATSINLYFSPQLAITEGLGSVKEVAHLRLAQAMIGNLIFWGVLLLTKELYATALVPIVMALTTPWWLAWRNQLARFVIPGSKELQLADWRNQIFPMQWRIALSWVCGYLIFQLFTPTIFHYQGAIAAGQVGISMAVFSQITNVSISWIMAKAPHFGTLIASGRLQELKSLFFKLLMASAAFNLMGVLGTLLIAYGLHAMGSRYADRVLPLPDLVILGAAAFVNHLIFAMATFMRAHKIEPMLLNSAVNAFLIATSTLIFARYGLHWVLSGYLLASALIGLPWTYWLFKDFWAGRRGQLIENHV